jgi:hypothetical protein
LLRDPIAAHLPGLNTATGDYTGVSHSGTTTGRFRTPSGVALK